MAAAAAAMFLVERGFTPPRFNRTMNGTNTTNAFGGQMATNRTGINFSGNRTAQSNLIQNLVFANSKSVRTSTIILAAFNILAALVTASSILYDCYWASKRCNPKFKASKFCISTIHPAETFPLILAVGILIQGLVFAGVQGQGLKALLTSGCDLIAQFLFPALFIVPYIQVVFGIECAIRSLRSVPFQARGKYDVTICGGVILVMLIVTWIPTHVWPEPNTCFASLVFFIGRFGQLGFILLIVSGSLMILSTAIIFWRLSTVNLIDQHQRIAASRMVYYEVLGIVSMSFVVPYFFSLIDKMGDIKLAMMATVVLNLSGLMSGLLQLFLRSNTATTSFGPKIGRSWDRGKHEIRIFGPNELAMHAQLINPVTGPRTPRTELDRVSRTTSQASLIGPEKGRVISMDSLKGMKRYEAGELPGLPEPSMTKSPTSSRTHARKPSYSLFPGENNSPTKQQPTSIYDISDLSPPPPIHYSGGTRHRRDSSIASSATVQIGLRISHAPTPSKEDLDTLPLPSTTYKSRAPASPVSSTYSSSPLPSTTYSVASSSKPILPASPLKVQTSFPSPLPIPIPPKSPRRPMIVPAPLVTKSPEQSPTRLAAVNKTLPPTPKAFLNQIEKVRESNTQLSPAVYSPEKKLPAGIKTTASSSSGPMSATMPKASLGSPSSSPKRSNSMRRDPSSQKPTTKADWI